MCWLQPKLLRCKRNNTDYGHRGKLNPCSFQRSERQMKVNCVSQYLEHRQRSAPQKQKNGGLLGWNNTLSTNEPKDCPCKPAHARLRWRTALRHRGGRAECIRGIWICYYSSLLLFVHYCLPLFLLIFLIYFSQPFLSIPIHSYLSLFSFPTYSIFYLFLVVAMRSYLFLFLSFILIYSYPLFCFSYSLYFCSFRFFLILSHSLLFILIIFYFCLLLCILVYFHSLLFILIY